MPRRPPLTDARRQALLACWHAHVLTVSYGWWKGSDLHRPINPPVVSDLVRDGLMRIDRPTRSSTSWRAYLTPRGEAVAKQLAEAAGQETHLQQAAE